MRFETGFSLDLARELKESEGLFKPGGLTRQELMRLVNTPVFDNIETVQSVEAGDCIEFNHDGKHEALGHEVLKKGELAICLVPDSDVCCKKLLSKLTRVLRFKQNTWLMVPPSQRSDVEACLVMSDKVKLFEQYEMPALTPMSSIIKRNGNMLFVPTGTGDVVPSLNRSGLLDDFVSNGGKYVAFLSTSNAKTFLEPEVIGLHVKKNSDATVVVTDRIITDRGGTLLWANGQKIIVDDDRLPNFFDIRQENTLIDAGVMILNVECMSKSDLIPWRYTKKRTLIDNQLITSFARSNNQWLEHLTDVEYIKVPRKMCYEPK